MAVDVSLLRAYTNGSVSVTAYGDASITLPTNASAALSADFAEVGAVTDAGITESTSQEWNDIYIWQANLLARRVPGKYGKTFKFAAAETNLTVLGIQFTGSTITQTAEGVTIEEKVPGTDTRSWVLHGIDGTRAQRIVIPSGEVTERGDVVWAAENITVYEWTLTAYPDSNLVVAYRYYLDASLDTAS